MNMRIALWTAGLFMLGSSSALVSSPAYATLAAQQPGAPASAGTHMPRTVSGPLTRQAMQRAMASHKVALVQEALDSTGANLVIDGIWGPRTEHALRHYQQSHGLMVTGQLDHATTVLLDPIG